jgi:RNA polymerase sigma-70 factor (sigma-E family)
VNSTRSHGSADDAARPADDPLEALPAEAETHDSFEAFVRARSEALFRTAFVLTGQRAAAEDLVQETLARVLLVWDRIIASGEPEPYSYRVMTNTHRRAWRKAAMRERATALLPDRPGHDDFARAEHLDQLSRVLARLPARQRCAVVLRHYVQMSEAETAAAMNCRVGTVKSLTSRGLAQLRAALADAPPLPSAQPLPPAPAPAGRHPADRSAHARRRTQRNETDG